jgi:hypothetical protein
VTIRLITAASRTPRAMRKWKTHTPRVDRPTARRVSPTPKSGKNAPSVAVMKTQWNAWPVAVPKRAGSEKTPAPTMDPMTIAVRTGRLPLPTVDPSGAVVTSASPMRRT